MAPMQRKKGSTVNTTNDKTMPILSNVNYDYKKKRNNSSIAVIIILFILGLILFESIFEIPTKNKENSNDDLRRGKNRIDSPSSSSWTEIFNVAINMNIAFQWKEVTINGITHKKIGPHAVKITNNCNTSNDSSIVYAYVSQDALVDVPLVEESSKEWIGHFTLPIDGEFQFNVKAVACDGNGKYLDSSVHSFKVIQSEQNDSVAAEGKNTLLMHDLIAKGAWIAPNRLQLQNGNNLQSDYVWMNPILMQNKNEMFQDVGLSDAFLVLKSSLTSNQFYDFKSLSNYELVCFFGSQSASDIRKSFLELRSFLFPQQRPFKFHYYDVNNLVTPDETWLDSTKSTFRKCKHIMVSIDEPKQPISQSEYKNQIMMLIKHLIVAFDDETFPIWIYTTMESPMNSRNCHSLTGKRSTEHPCNVVLKELFAQNSSPFTNRVRLLDNTDLTNPQLYQNLQSLESNLALRKDILAVVALRTFIVVGYQVAEWRKNKQVGHINGLTKGDKEYPNFELIPYDFSTKVE